MSKILAIGNIKGNININLKNIFKEQLQNKEVQIIDFGYAIIFKNDKENDVINILNTNVLEYGETVSILEYLEKEIRQNNCYVDIAGMEITWEECKFDEKIENGEIELESLFDVNVEDADDYLYDLMNKAMIDVLESKMEEIERALKDIENGQFLEW